jgi:outer membrane protein TolC
VADADAAVRIALAQYAAGTIDLTRLTLLQQNLVPAEDTLAQAQGEIALGLIQVYRALGGGWQIRTAGGQPGAKGAAAPETVPPPRPSPIPSPPA